MASLLTSLGPHAHANPVPRQLIKDAVLVLRSGVFRRRWYLARYHDVARARASALRHFLMFGGAEGRDPGPAFSSAAYLAANPDISASGINPLVHYLRHGKREGRGCFPVMDEVVQSDSRAFDLMSIPAGLCPPDVAPEGDFVIGPAAGNRAALLEHLACAPPAKLVINWEVLKDNPGEWAGLWTLEGLGVTRQVLDACCLARQRGWDVSVYGSVDLAESPLFATVRDCVTRLEDQIT